MICAKSSKDSSTFMMGNTLLSVGKIIGMNDHENGAFTTISPHKLARMGDDPVAEQTRQQAWREDWDESRNGRLAARGDRTKQGNPLYIARKVSQKTGPINNRDYEGLLRRVLAGGDLYHVEILRRQGRYPVRITVDEVSAPIQTVPSHGWVGMDTNSTFLALCHIHPDGNPQAIAALDAMLSARERFGLSKK